MAVKRSMKKAKAAPIKRSIKRASPVDEFIDANAGEAEMADIVAQEEVDAGMDTEIPADAMEDFQEAPLTPEQQAEKDSMEGSNAAARAGNPNVPTMKSIQKTVNNFIAKSKREASYAEFMKLSPDERDAVVLAEQEEIKARRAKQK